MRLLIGQEERLPLLATDASSLCREQVEKLFVFALIAQDPDKWIKQYRRNDWRTTYEHHLLEMEEFGQLSRFQQAPDPSSDVLDRMRHWPDRTRRRGYEVVVSGRAARAVKFNFHRPSTKGNQWPKYMRRETFDRYFAFPTPGKAIRQIKNDLVRQLLVRWYDEYKFYSSYTHTMVNKVLLQRGSRDKGMHSGARVAAERSRLVMESLFTSYAAVASVCTITAPLLVTHFGAIPTLKEFWELLSRTSLFGRVMWECLAKKLLP